MFFKLNIYIGAVYVSRKALLELLLYPVHPILVLASHLLVIRIDLCDLLLEHVLK